MTREPFIPPSRFDLRPLRYPEAWWRRWSALDWSLAVSVLLAVACVVAAVLLVGGAP